MSEETKPRKGWPLNPDALANLNRVLSRFAAQLKRPEPNRPVGQDGDPQ